MILSLKTAFGWDEGSYNIVLNWSNTLMNSGVLPSSIANAIKAKDKNNDISSVNDWILYLFDEVKNRVKTEVENNTTDTNITDTINKMFGFDMTIDGANSLTNTILDYMIVDQRSNIDNLSQECIKETMKYLTYFKPVADSNS